ncbi:hypothetical protein IQ279_07020 [Streptomyces verrucosisporus]|uniref:hypothetical protein n=1 Tax=Streptomyces verrucosisporus TaxID=1695161 RepID=UPI0019D15B0B|nr:hypothetical protein [Streptomyces verrucosisporus]MBN3929394.1 hypothetical protein [Streptomyces verrucosisporus]
MTRAAAWMRFWCELSASAPGRPSRIMLGSHLAPTPRLAVRWMRGQAERVARALDPGPGAPWLPPACLRPVRAEGAPDPGSVIREWARAEAERENALGVLREGWSYTVAAHDETAHYRLAAWPLVLPPTGELRVYRRIHATAQAAPPTPPRPRPAGRP